MSTFNKSPFLFIKKFLSLLFISVLIVFCLFLNIVSNPRFQDTYQSAIHRKYMSLITTNEKKIVIIGGSNVGFGINTAYLEEKTGMKVVNLGLHAGFGNLFNTEIMKQNIQKGDIVLLGYEYSLYYDSFDKLGDINLIMSGIDNHIEMYKAIPFGNYSEILGNLLDYANYKYQYIENTIGTYSISSFDINGNMILDRKGYTIDNYLDKIEHYGKIEESLLLLSDNNADYLRNLKTYLSSKGVETYMIAPSLLQDAVFSESDAFYSYINEIENKTEIDYISDPTDYFFDKEYMFDTIYHCNSKGEIKRTEQLFEDLKPYINM